jgi:hypothetical protein
MHEPDSLIRRTLIESTVQGKLEGQERDLQMEWCGRQQVRQYTSLPPPEQLLRKTWGKLNPCKHSSPVS